MSSATDPDLEFLSSSSIAHLNHQQKILYKDQREDLITYLRQKGKNPQRNRGYSASNIRPMARRIHQVHEFAWQEDPTSLILSPDDADQFISALNQDTVLASDGNPYTEGSKRKYRQALEAYFRFRDINWEPDIKFSDGEGKFSSDPFLLDEREQLLNASYEYRSPPTYGNVSPTERNRWNRHLAQELGKPKESIGPADWDNLRTSWKFPSLLSTTLDCGWRAAMVGRLKIPLVNLDEGHIIIPPKIAVKNNKKWTAELSERSTRMLQLWSEQRNNRPKYDDDDRIWLNRKGNPYNSKTLNHLLRNLIDLAGIDAEGRTLTWHSIRHSTGMYIYDQHKDLGLVAEILRHSSLEAARKYSHPTPESKQDVIESIQGGRKR